MATYTRYNEILDFKCINCGEYLMGVFYKKNSVHKTKKDKKQESDGGSVQSDNPEEDVLPFAICLKCMFVFPFYSSAKKEKNKIQSVDDALFYMFYKNNNQYQKLIDNILALKEKKEKCIMCGSKHTLMEGRWHFYCKKCKLEIPKQSISVARLQEQFGKEFDEQCSVFLPSNNYEEYFNVVESIGKRMFFIGVHNNKKLVLLEGGAK